MDLGESKGRGRTERSGGKENCGQDVMYKRRVRERKGHRERGSEGEKRKGRKRLEFMKRYVVYVLINRP